MVGIKAKGFTLIELLIVMSIVALLITMVGPMTIRGLERAEAKQEMLTMKNWLRKISYRAFVTGQPHILKLSGKKAELFVEGDEEHPIVSQSLESLFFQPQVLRYNTKGFVSPVIVEGTYRNKLLKLDLRQWVNSQVADD